MGRKVPRTRTSFPVRGDASKSHAHTHQPLALFYTVYNFMVVPVKKCEET